MNSFKLLKRDLPSFLGVFVCLVLVLQKPGFPQEKREPQNSSQQELAQTDEGKRHSIPSAAELRKATRTIKALYGDSFASRDAKVIKEAAKTLVKDAVDTKDEWPIRYRMLVMAREVFVDIVEVPEFEKTCKQLCTDFELNFESEIVAGLGAMSKNLRDQGTAMTVANASKSWASKFSAAKNFDAAKKTSAVFQTIARKLRDKKLLEDAKLLRSKISKLEKICSDYVVAVKNLKLNPDDPDANLVAAKYFSMVETDFEKAIPLFVKASDKDVAAIAKNELDGRKMEAAEGWLKIGKKGDAMDEVIYLKRSRKLFLELVKKETGITKRKCDRALATINDLLVTSNERFQDPNNLGRIKGTVIVLKIKTTSPKAILLWDATSEVNYGVIFAQKSEDPGLKHASSIKIDGEPQTETKRKDLYVKIADGREHDLHVTMGEGFESWKEFSAESNKKFHSGTWQLANGYVKFVGFQLPNPNN